MSLSRNEFAQLGRLARLAFASKDSKLLAVIDDAIAAKPNIVAKIRSGKPQAAGALIGAVMKATRGKANASQVRAVLLERWTVQAGLHASHRIRCGRAKPRGMRAI